MNSAIIVAAGRSERMGGKMDKAFLSLGSHPVLAYSLRVFQECSDIDSIVLVVRREQQIAAKSVVKLFGIAKLRAIVAGGTLRQASVEQGMQALDPDTRIVCVHDAARPCVTSALISETIKSAKRHGSGVAATRITDTVKIVERGQVVASTLDRSKVWTVQTPQTFRFELLRRAFDELSSSGGEVTDESSAVERLGENVHLVQSLLPNIKITTPDDLQVAAALLGIQ